MLMNSVVTGLGWRMDIISSALVSDQQGYQYQRVMAGSQIGEIPQFE